MFYDVLRYTHRNEAHQRYFIKRWCARISAGRIYRTECFNKHNRVAICGIAVHKNNDLGVDDLTFPLASCRIKRSLRRCDEVQLWVVPQNEGDRERTSLVSSQPAEKIYIASLRGIHTWNYSLAPLVLFQPLSYSSTLFSDGVDSCGTSYMIASRPGSAR